jgi:hypothetical protein
LNVNENNRVFLLTKKKIELLFFHIPRNNLTKHENMLYKNAEYLVYTRDHKYEDCEMYFKKLEDAIEEYKELIVTLDEDDYDSIILRMTYEDDDENIRDGPILYEHVNEKKIVEKVISENVEE